MSATGTGGQLAGWSVVVPRPRDRASSLSDRIRALGADVIEVPVIEIADPPDGGRGLRSAADRLVAGSYRWVACTSQPAVERLAHALGGRPVSGATRWAAVGPATARAVAATGHWVDLVAPGGTAADLAAAFPPVAGTPAPRVLFPRAETVDGALAEGLAAAGYEVDEVVAYRTVRGRPDPGVLEAARRAGAVAFTSSSTVEGLIDVVGKDGVPPVVVSIGPQTSATARRAGLIVAAEAAPHDLDGLVGALTAVLTSTRSAARGAPRGARHPRPA